MPRQRKRPIGMPDDAKQGTGKYLVRTPEGQVEVVSKSTWTSFSGHGRRDGLARKFDTQDLSRPYEQDDRVFAVVSLIADAFSDVPLCVYNGDPLMEEGEVERVTDHPIAKLFETWNPVHDAALAQTAMAQGLCLDGEIPLVFTREGGERLQVYGEGAEARMEVPGECWPIMGKQIREEIDRSTGMLSKWVVRTGKGTKEYDPCTVINPRILHPRNPYRGFGPMEAAWGASAQNYLAERYRNSLLRKGGDPGGLILIGEILEAEERKRLKAEIAQDFDDPDAGGSTKLLEGGAEYKPLAMSPKEMAYVESLAHNADRVSAAFRVSKELLGQGDSNFGARLREELQAFWRMRVIPWLRLVERSLNSFLFPKLVDPRAQLMRARFDLSKVEALKGDVAAKVELAIKLQQSGVPLNQAMQLAKVEGAMDIPGGDVPLIVGNWTRLEDVGAAPEPLPIPEAPEPQGAPEPQEDEAEADGATVAANVPEGAAADPKHTLGGGQLQGLLQIIEKVALGDLPKATGVKAIVASYPFDTARATDLLAEIEEDRQRPAPPAPPAPDAGPEEQGAEDDEELPAASPEERAADAELQVLWAGGQWRAEYRQAFEERRDEVHAAWKKLANMTATQLKTWAQNPCSKRASVSPAAVIKRNLELLETPKADWRPKHVRNANRAISFIERMRGAEQGEPAVQGCPSKRDISLRNWAHNPGGRIGTTGKTQTATKGWLQLAVQADKGKLSDDERKAFMEQAQRRRYPFERELTSKVRRVQDRMRRAQLKALADFAKTGSVKRRPRIEGWQEQPRKHFTQAQVDALLRRLDEDAEERREFALTWEGPAVSKYLKRRGWTAEEAQARMMGALLSKANVDPEDLDALIVSAEQRWADELANLMQVPLEKLIQNELASAAASMGIPVVPMTNPAIQRFLRTKPIQVAEGTSSTIARQVRQKLLRRLQESANITDLQRAVLEIQGLLSNEVRSVYSYARQRALAIARTETHQATMAARKTQVDQALATGEAIGVRWITGGGLPESAGGGRRDNHWRLNNKVIPADGRFDLGGGITAAHPGDQSLPASELVNCGCSFAAVIPDLKEDGTAVPTQDPAAAPDATGAPAATPKPGKGAPPEFPPPKRVAKPKVINETINYDATFNTENEKGYLDDVAAHDQAIRGMKHERVELDDGTVMKFTPKSAFASYTGNSHSGIRKLEAGITAPSADNYIIQAKAQIIRDTFGKVKLSKPRTVYRGMGFDTAAERQAYLNKWIDGVQVTLEATTSTSVDPLTAASFAKGDAPLGIIIENAQGIAVEGFTEVQLEQEIILGRGMKLELIAYERQSSFDGLRMPVLRFRQTSTEVKAWSIPVLSETQRKAMSGGMRDFNKFWSKGPFLLLHQKPVE